MTQPTKASLFLTQKVVNLSSLKSFKLIDFMMKYTVISFLSWPFSSRFVVYGNESFKTLVVVAPCSHQFGRIATRVMINSGILTWVRIHVVTFPVILRFLLPREWWQHKWHKIFLYYGMYPMFISMYYVPARWLS